MKMKPVEYTQGCSDGGCCLRIGPRPGQVTNGGCRCLRDVPTELRIKIMRKFAHARARLAEESVEHEQLVEIMHWTQAAVTALAVGDIRSGSPLHHKLRDVMIAYRAAKEGQDEQS